MNRLYGIDWLCRGFECELFFGFFWFFGGEGRGVQEEGWLGKGEDSEEVGMSYRWWFWE